jgi:hypothetical protein
LIFYGILDYISLSGPVNLTLAYAVSAFPHLAGKGIS